MVGMNTPPKPEQYVGSDEFLRAWSKFASGDEVPLPTAYSFIDRLTDALSDGCEQLCAEGSLHEETFRTLLGSRYYRREAFLRERITVGSAAAEFYAALASYVTRRVFSHEVMIAVRRSVDRYTTRSTRTGDIKIKVEPSRTDMPSRGIPRGLRLRVVLSFNYYPPRTRNMRETRVRASYIERVATWLSEFPGSEENAFAWLLCALCHDAYFRDSMGSHVHLSHNGRSASVVRWTDTAGSSEAIKIIDRVPAVVLV